MTLVVFVGAVILLGVALIAIAWPLLQERRGVSMTGLAGDTSSVTDPLIDLVAQRDAIYQAIRELRFDHQVGKVSEADYEAFNTQLRSQAVRVLKEIDGLKQAEADPDLDARLETEIAALRQVNGSGPVQTAPASPVPADAAAPTFCPRCGQRLHGGDRFCGKCGAALS